MMFLGVRWGAKRIACGLLAVASTVFAFVVTHLPAPSAFGASEADLSRRVARGAWHTVGEVVHGVLDHLPDAPALLDPLRSDKTIHVLLFVGPGFFWALTFGGRLRARSALVLLGLLAAWAGLDEGSQHVVSRDGELGDWLANVAGATIGVAGGWAAWSALRTLRGRRGG